MVVLSRSGLATAMPASLVGVLIYAETPCWDLDPATREFVRQCAQREAQALSWEYWELGPAAKETFQALLPDWVGTLEDLLEISRSLA